MDVAQVDLVNISHLAERLLKSIDNRTSLQGYLHSKMGCVAPNLSELIGDQVSCALLLINDLRFSKMVEYRKL